jgi:hypothetical protein
MTRIVSTLAPSRFPFVGPGRGTFLGRRAILPHGIHEEAVDFHRKPS